MRNRLYFSKKKTQSGTQQWSSKGLLAAKVCVPYTFCKVGVWKAHVSLTAHNFYNPFLAALSLLRFSNWLRYSGVYSLWGTPKSFTWIPARLHLPLPTLAETLTYIFFIPNTVLVHDGFPSKIATCCKCTICSTICSTQRLVSVEEGNLNPGHTIHSPTHQPQPLGTADGALASGGNLSDSGSRESSPCQEASRLPPTHTHT